VTELTEAQKKLIELDAKKPEIKAWYEDLDAALAAVAEESGVDSYFQAPDATVFKLQKAEGRYVTFSPFEYVRTKREGEARGTLSIKEADEWRSKQAE
jgi:hypothetical protein